MRLVHDENWSHFCFVGGRLFDCNGQEVRELGTFTQKDFAGREELRPNLWCAGKRVRIVQGSFGGLQPEFSRSVQTIWTSNEKGELIKRENDVAYQIVQLVPYQTRFVFHPEEENSSMRIRLTMRDGWIVERRVHVPYYSQVPSVHYEFNRARTVVSKSWGMKDEWIRDPSARVSS